VYISRTGESRRNFWKCLGKAESELMRFEIIPYDYKIAKKSAEIEAQLTKSGQIISLTDI